MLIMLNLKKVLTPNNLFWTWLFIMAMLISFICGFQVSKNPIAEARKLNSRAAYVIFKQKKIINDQQIEIKQLKDFIINKLDKQSKEEKRI